MAFCAHIDHYYYYLHWRKIRHTKDKRTNAQKKKIMKNKIYWFASNFRRIELCKATYLRPKWATQEDNNKTIPGKKELITRRIYWIKWSQTNTFNATKCMKMFKTNSRLVNASINIVVIFVIFPIFNINYNSMRHLAVTSHRCEIINKILDTFCHE